jgi:hypothetical protein
MSAALRQKETAIWLLLLVVTFAGFGSAQAHGWGFALVMLAATAKAWLIARYYMDMRSAPLTWRIVFDVLIVAIGAMILALHFLK